MTSFLLLGVTSLAREERDKLRISLSCRRMRNSLLSCGDDVHFSNKVGFVYGDRPSSRFKGDGQSTEGSVMIH